MSMNRYEIIIYACIVFLVFSIGLGLGTKMVENNVPLLKDGSEAGKVYFDNQAPVIGFENGKPAYIGFPITEIRK